MSFIYLAQPYSHPNRATMHARWRVAEEVVAHALRNGEHIYSPIVHNHALAERFSLPTNFDFWEPFDFTMISASSLLRILQMPGWEHSRGVDAEMKFAIKHGKPIEMFDPTPLGSFQHFSTELNAQ